HINLSFPIDAVRRSPSVVEPSSIGNRFLVKPKNDAPRARGRRRVSGRGRARSGSAAEPRGGFEHGARGLAAGAALVAGAEQEAALLHVVERRGHEEAELFVVAVERLPEL